MTAAANPQHTCINTATTSNGQPPPPCRARASDEEWQSIFSRLTDAANTGSA